MCLGISTHNADVAGQIVLANEHVDRCLQKLDADNTAAWSDRLAQGMQRTAYTAADIENLLTGRQAKCRHRGPAQGLELGL